MLDKLSNIKLLEMCEVINELTIVELLEICKVEVLDKLSNIKLLEICEVEVLDKLSDVELLAMLKELSDFELREIGVRITRSHAIAA